MFVTYEINYLYNQEKVTKLFVIWYIGARKAENKSFVVSLTISRFLEGFIESLWIWLCISSVCIQCSDIVLATGHTR